MAEYRPNSGTGRTTYEAAANLAQWDRVALERSEHPKSGT
jgi:hypothetical protein